MGGGKARAMTPGAQARLGVGPRLLQLRADAQLTLDEQRLEQTISETARRVEVYTIFAVETTARFQPVFDAVAQLTPAVIRDIYTASRNSTAWRTTCSPDRGPTISQAGL